MSTLYLCGAGNPEGVRLALTLQTAHRRWTRIVLLDDAREKLGTSLLSVEVVGGFDLLEQADPREDRVVNLVARTTAGRRRARDRIRRYGIPFEPLVHPDVDTLGVEHGDDFLAYAHAILGPESRIGDGTVVFMGAMVGHESRVGPGCVLAANAVLNARVTLGERVYVGTNATVLPEIEIGDGATVGAGSVVLSRVSAGATVMGVPAEVLFAGERPREGAFEPPRDATERAVADAWQEILEATGFGIHDDFFRAGGDSLRMLALAETLGSRFGVELSVRELFAGPTIAGMARSIEDRVLGEARQEDLTALLTEVES